MIDHPAALERSVLLALGLASARGSDGPTRTTVGRVEGDDEPHTVVPAEPDDAAGPSAALAAPAGLHHLRGDLTAVVATFRAAGSEAAVAALLPAPGDALGLPPSVAAAALDAGECVLGHTGDAWVAVPDVVGFGSALEPGHQVTWTVHGVPDWRLRLPGVVGTLGEAERALREALLAATATLTALDVARWRPDAAATIDALRSPHLLDLPPGLDPRVVRVLAEAARLRTIVDLAVADDGAAVTLGQADRRSGALRDLERAARRAIAAATLAAGRVQPSTDR